MLDRPAIERLVRGDLGCTCPPEVFAQIEESPLRLAGLARPGRRIAIGGRLLVYLLDIDDADEALAGLQSWLAAGRAERDGAAMNRLRLVVVTSDPDALGPVLQARFDTLPDRDDRTHLHVLRRTVVASLR
jgi:hypothetical protein